MRGVKVIDANTSVPRIAVKFNSYSVPSTVFMSTQRKHCIHSVTWIFENLQRTMPEAFKTEKRGNIKAKDM